MSAGLTETEARRRLEALGPNQIARASRWRRLRELASLLADPMALMLLGTAALYLFLGETRDGLMMLAALVPVLGIDVLLEARSRAALRALAGRVSPRATVVRDGQEREVPASELVPGDLLLLREGDILAADGVIREAANLALDEAALTGESEPRPKRPEAGEESAFFAGSVVLCGHGQGEVLATGAGTRYGDIARLVAASEGTATPLQQRTGRLVRRLALVAALVAVIIFALGLARGQAWWQALLAALSLAMAAIPEEFPLVFTLFLSTGAWRLGRKGMLVRRLAAVETLGSTTVICTDKTGTLTEGRFTLDAVVPLDGAGGERALLEAAVLACEEEPADPLERAVLQQAPARGVELGALRRRWTLERDYDFDPEGRHMTHVWRARAGGVSGGPERVIASKGALEGVLEHCQISDGQRQAAEAANRQLAAQAMRVLAVARRDEGPAPSGERADHERGLTLLGLLGFRDPLRPGIPAAVALCRRAGVAVKLVTGDHPETARAIAAEAGLASAGAVVTGAELEAMPAAERRQIVASRSVFARVSPRGKHLMVEALREAGEVVAMTGDGINDAPALRRAHIGVSMGQRASAVARAAADMVLLEDDLGALVAAIREGRALFRDIQRVFLYLIAFHIPIVGLALLSPVLGLPLVLLPVHLVWLELIVHPVSALAFRGEGGKDDDRLMALPPRRPEAALLSRPALVASLVAGGALAAAVLGLFLFALPRGEDAARSLALVGLLCGYQGLVLVERASLRQPGEPRLPRSRRFWLTWLVSGAGSWLVFQIPAVAALFRVSGPRPLDVLLAAGVGLGAVLWRYLLPR